uniref:Nucleic acid-binding, OB-fold, replication protein A, OB domain protein n=1 Tax=Tanacetum cinerariifolium TaxID=118510 RepID=A0A6L2P4R7_TANCI|nr:nucleic acid-binding, OB-fold, replication protein A, OB domain protein [Tanacetum cinerariifolium]
MGERGIASVAKLIENRSHGGDDHCVTHLTTFSSYSFKNDFLNNLPKVCINDIRNIGKAMSCVVVVTVKKIERESNWWYLACVKCNHKAGQDTITEKDKYGVIVKNRIIFMCTNKACGQDTDVKYKQALLIIDSCTAELLQEVRKKGDMDILSTEFNKLLKKPMLSKLISKISTLKRTSIRMANQIQEIMEQHDVNSIPQEIGSGLSATISDTSLVCRRRGRPMKEIPNGQYSAALASDSLLENSPSSMIMSNKTLSNTNTPILIIDLLPQRRGRQPLTNISNTCTSYSLLENTPSSVIMSNQAKENTNTPVLLTDLFPRRRGRTPLTDISNDLLTRRIGRPPMSVVSIAKLSNVSRLSNKNTNKNIVTPVYAKTSAPICVEGQCSAALASDSLLENSPSSMIMSNKTLSNTNTPILAKENANTPVLLTDLFPRRRGRTPLTDISNDLLTRRIGRPPMSVVSIAKLSNVS